MKDLSVMWSVTVVALDQIWASTRCYKYELVLTPTECPMFYRENVTGWRKTLKCDLKFHTIHAIMGYSNYSTWFWKQQKYTLN